MSKVELSSVFELESKNDKIVPKLFETFSLLFFIKHNPLIEFLYFCSFFLQFLKWKMHFFNKRHLYDGGNGCNSVSEISSFPKIFHILSKVYHKKGIPNKILAFEGLHCLNDSFSNTYFLPKAINMNLWLRNTLNCFPFHLVQERYDETADVMFYHLLLHCLL